MDGRFPPAALLLGAALLWSALGAACGGAGGGAPPQHAAALYSDDSATRARAAEQLIALGQAGVPHVDPFESACIRSDSFPYRCRNFDRALALTVTILEAVAAAGGDTVNPAKDLLWHMVYSPAGDVFDELGQRDEWARTDAEALRRRALAALGRLMTIRADLGASDVARHAVARAEEGARRWYLLTNCAGATMSAGCNYGSYLFRGDGQLVSFRLIRYDDPDNFGAGFTLSLSFMDREGRLGLARAVGGFGGDLVTLTLYRLGEVQAPLCTLVAADAARELLDHWRRYVTVATPGCRVAERDARVQIRTYP